MAVKEVDGQRKIRDKGYVGVNGRRGVSSRDGNGRKGNERRGRGGE